jgi:hypothetical protein
MTEPKANARQNPVTIRRPKLHRTPRKRRPNATRKGMVYSVEILFVCIILVVGISGGLAALRASVETALANLGQSILALDPGYHVVSTGSTTGSSNGTVMTHMNPGLTLGAAGQASTNTTQGTDALRPHPVFGTPITP